MLSWDVQRLVVCLCFPHGCAASGIKFCSPGLMLLYQEQLTIVYTEALSVACKQQKPKEYQPWPSLYPHGAVERPPSTASKAKVLVLCRTILLRQHWLHEEWQHWSMRRAYASAQCGFSTLAEEASHLL